MARLTTLTFDQTPIYSIYDNNAILPVLIHCLDPAKTPHRYIGSYHVNIQSTTSKMSLLGNPLTGSAVRTFHFILTLSKQEQNDLISQTQVDVHEALYKIADDIAYRCAKNYQVVYAVHEDVFNPHIHFIIINDSPIEYNDPHVPAYDGYDCEVFIKNYLYFYYGFRLHISNHGEYYKNMLKLSGRSECSWERIKDCISKRYTPGDASSGDLRHIK